MTETTGQDNAIAVRPTTEGALSLKEVTDRVNLVHSVLEKVMQKGTHFGTVPGCGTKMVLLKPGADVLAMTFRLSPSYEIDRTDLPNDHREYVVTCSMFGPAGVVLGQGVGSASTMEKKYRYRWDDDGDDRKRIENEDIADVYNTVLKIAKKRAHVDATLTVTGAADLFTQDLIENEDAAAAVVGPRPQAKRPAQKAAANGDTLTGVVDGVTMTGGTNAKGAWTKYAVKVDGKVYSTFSSDIGKAAESLKGLPAVLTLEKKGKYTNVVGIEPGMKDDPFEAAPFDRAEAAKILDMLPSGPKERARDELGLTGKTDDDMTDDEIKAWLEAARDA